MGGAAEMWTTPDLHGQAGFELVDVHGQSVVRAGDVEFGLGFHLAARQAEVAVPGAVAAMATCFQASESREPRRVLALALLLHYHGFHDGEGMFVAERVDVGANAHDGHVAPLFP